MKTFGCTSPYCAGAVIGRKKPALPLSLSLLLEEREREREIELNGHRGPVFLVCPLATYPRFPALPLPKCPVATNCRELSFPAGKSKRGKIPHFLATCDKVEKSIGQIAQDT
jgi:hypothetical protein